jgi:hypothetical protein
MLRRYEARDRFGFLARWLDVSDGRRAMHWGDVRQKKKLGHRPPAWNFQTPHETPLQRRGFSARLTKPIPQSGE